MAKQKFIENKNRNGDGLLKYRLISSFCLISIAILVLFLFSLKGFAIITLIVCMLAAWEWGTLSNFSMLFKYIWLFFLFIVLSATMLFLLSEHQPNVYRLIVSVIFWVSLSWWIIALLLVISYPTSSIFWKNSKVLHLISGVLIIFPFFVGMLILRIWDYRRNFYSGSLWIFYVMLLVWGADSGAYVLGKTFGKNKLLPKVSPKKTWQGFIGGLIVAIFVSFSYNFLINKDIFQTKLLICSIFTTLASVLGDLTESMFKREAGIKDSSHIIPGHGGILDRIDSLTAAVPVFVYFLFQVFKII